MRKILSVIAILLFTTLSANAQIAVFQGTLSAKATKPFLAALALGTATRPDTQVFVYEETDGTLTLKINNLDVTYSKTNYDIGNVQIINFTRNGNVITTEPKGDADNVILTPGDDPSKDWVVTEETSVKYSGSATLSDETLTFKVPVTATLMGFADVTIELSYNGDRIDNGISNIVIDEKEDARKYNVAGLPFKGGKGIFIQKGRKYISK